MHLTFQEYLAAWHLSNQELDDALPLIRPHIRRQKWFEVLQLLGGEWAKQSDEKLDRYLGWLLGQHGTTIAERAPVVALCANIVKDATGVAELKPQTRQAYRAAVQSTLAVFRPRSGVPDKTQLEILEALGELGAAVKPHLIDATKSGLYAVRCRAIEMLLPHLSDDELFDSGHVMADRSKEPIKTFLMALLQRDIERTTAWLLQRKNFQQKATEAIGNLVFYLAYRLTSDVLLNVLSTVFLKSTDGWARGRFLKILAIKFRNEIRIWNMVREAAISDPDAWEVRPEALKLLVQYQKEDPSTWQIIREAATKDSSGYVRREGLTILANHKRDDQATWQIIRAAAASDTDSSYVRPEALTLLASSQKNDQATWQIILEAATNAPEWGARRRGLELLADGQKDDPTTWQMIRAAATKDANPYVRSTMCGLLLRHVDCNEVQRKLMSRNFNGRYSWHDPQELITSAHAARAAQELNLDVDEVRRQYEELATRLRIELNLEWRMRN